MTAVPIPAGYRRATQPHMTDAALAVAFERAAGDADAGERRSWDLPEAADAAASATQVATWLRHLLAVPWCLDTASVAAVCKRFELMLAGGVRPGRVEVLCHAADDHRRPTVYLAVSAWRDGVLQSARIARVEAVVASAP